jgi:carbamoyl-phosphate synthase large subunit
MRRIKLLMTGAGAPGAAGIIKCLKKYEGMELAVCDANPNAVGKYLAENFFTIPKADDPEFTESVINICKKTGSEIVLPLVTRELFPLSAAKHTFGKSGIKVLVSDEHALGIANDKSKLYTFLDHAGIRVPQYRVVKNIKDFERAVRELGFPQKRVCFKPSISNGSRGFRILDDTVNEFDLLFNHKPNSTFMSYADSIRILSSTALPELLVSEYLPGEEYSVDCLVDHGKCRLAVPRIRLKMSNGISVEGAFEKNEEIIEYASSIVEKIGLHGNIGVQVKKADNGKYLILEINPRVQGTIVSALGAGVNLPLLAVKQELGLQIDPSELKVKWGTHFSRYWEEVYY